MRIIIYKLLLVGSLLGLVSCSDQSDSPTVNSQQDTNVSGSAPWYTDAQVKKGYAIYQANCAQCHKVDASGDENWRKLDANNKYPPPPLNGTAHTWHHPLSVLRMTVKKGGVALGGSMPGFDGKLSGEEINEVLAWVQSRWPKEIYASWEKRNTQSLNR